MFKTKKLLAKKLISSSGFTLLELLVVVAIIGLLSSMATYYVNLASINARDTVRVNHLDQVRKALEMYHIKYGEYPQEDLDPWPCDNDCQAQNWSNLLDELKSEGLIVIDNNIKVGLLDYVISGFLLKANAAYNPTNTKPQDPLWPDYTYSYMPSGPAGSSEYLQNYRLRAKLEYINSQFLNSSLEGLFLYTDKPNSKYGCAKSLGYYCIGPFDNFKAFEPGKPVIYLYPTQEQKVSVKIWPKNIHQSVPAYNDGWRVIASPDGTLYNLADQKEYPYLFWEGESEEPIIERGTGFVTNKENIEQFLTEKLALLGLNEKETADFIEFWAPRMKTKDYVYVYFMPQKDFD